MLGFLIVKKESMKMKKQFVIIGMITFLAMLNLPLTSNFSWGSGNQDSTSKEEYLKIIDLLQQQIKENENQIENVKKVYQAIIGNKIAKPAIQDPRYFLKDPKYFLQKTLVIYPSPQKSYIGMKDHQFRNRAYIERLITSVNVEENRALFLSFPQQRMHDIINTRLNYNGIIEKAVSLQAFQNAEERFTQIANFLNDITKTKDLREVFELQTRIRNMSSLLQNEYAKLQIVRNLSNNEETLIDIQKRMLYKKIINSANRGIPDIKFN